MLPKRHHLDIRGVFSFAIFSDPFYITICQLENRNNGLEKNKTSQIQSPRLHMDFINLQPRLSSRGG